jgi:hypothetical protein
MTTQADAHHHSPQLIPRRLLRAGQVHHPAVLDEARRRSENLQRAWPTGSPRLPGR